LLRIEAIYPKPSTSTPSPGHRIYPYLLRGVPITHVDQVWNSDIRFGVATKQVRFFCWSSQMLSLVVIVPLSTTTFYPDSVGVLDTCRPADCTNVTTGKEKGTQEAH
jgi:hypothetical protein